MRWIRFQDGSRYALAVDIQKLAESYGYVVPCEQDGTRHPGTDCNQKMRSIFKNAGLRRTFNLEEYSVVDVRMEDSASNSNFLRWLVDEGLVHSTYLRKGVIHLYTEQAVNALLSAMLHTYVEYNVDDEDEHFDCSIFVTKRSHNLEKRKYKPKASLFKK